MKIRIMKVVNVQVEQIVKEEGGAEKLQAQNSSQDIEAVTAESGELARPVRLIGPFKLRPGMIVELKAVPANSTAAAAPAD